MLKKVQKDVKNICEVMDILSNESRFLVLSYIWKGDKTVSQISKKLDISQSWVSQILARLKRGGIVEGKKKGTQVFYEIQDKKVLRLLKNIEEVYID